MRAGSLDRRIVIEWPRETQDESGQPVITWVLYARVWSQVQPLRGEERFAAQQVTATADTRFRVRFLAGVTPRMRILYGGQVYDITAVLEIGRQEGLEILAEGRVEAAR